MTCRRSGAEGIGWRRNRLAVGIRLDRDRHGRRYFPLPLAQPAQEFRCSLRQFLGETTTIDVRFVDSIPLVRTGKHQGSISNVEFDFQEVSAPLS